MNHDKPTVTEGQVEKAKMVLKGRGWQLSDDLCVWMQMPVTQNNRRILRAIAEESNGDIISSNDGYKLTDEASTNECNAAIARLKAQAEKMFARARKIEEKVAQKTNGWLL